MQENRKQIIVIICIVLALILIDQATKIYAISNLKENVLEVIPNILTFKYVENTGGAFGIGQNGTMTFIIANIVVLGLIIRFIIIQIERVNIKIMLILSLVLAGGFSNLIDRLFRGYVVDFINLFPNAKFPIFNIADIFIIIGWILLAFIFAINTWRDKKNNNNTKKVDNKVE